MGVTTRYEMLACRYHRQATVSEEGRANPEDQHGRRGLVRIHDPEQDRFRRFITIGQEDGFVSSDGEATKTFNRGSLIHYLNSELRYFGDKRFLAESNPLPHRLHVGWFGGLIRGSSDERIREACRAVFARYQAFEERTQVNHQINERHLVLAQLSCLDPNPSSVELHSSDYLDGAVHVSLSTFPKFAQFEFCMRTRHGGQSPSSNLHVRICLKDPDVDVSRVMQAISQIAFSGISAQDFRVSKIYLDLTPLSPLEEPRSESERSLILSRKMGEIFDWQKAQGANTREIFATRRHIEEVKPKAEGYGAIENACLVKDEVLDLAFLASEAATPMSTKRSFTMNNDREEIIASVNVHNVADSLEAVSMLPYIPNGDHYIRITICDPRVANEEAQQIFSELINLLKRALAGISNASGDVINVGLIRILIGQETIPDENARRDKERALQRIFNEKEWILPSA